MVNSEPQPSGREMEILKVLWDHGPCTVREVHELLCPDGELAFNTVQTLLRIMDDKGLVSHKKDGRSFVYSPLRSRDEEASRFLDSVFDGAMDQFVLSLLKSRKPTSKELHELRDLIAGARKNEKRKGKK